MSKPTVSNHICFAFIILYILPLQIFACNGKVPENMVLIPADDFAYRGDKNNPPIESFYIDKYEVTNHFYCQFLNEADRYGLHYTSEMEIDLADLGTKRSNCFRLHRLKVLLV